MERGGSIGDNLPAVFSAQGRYYLLHIRREALSEKITVGRVVIEASKYTADCARRGETLEGRIYGRTRCKIGEVDLGEAPTPPFAIYPAKYLLLNTLHGPILPCFDRNLYTFSGH